MKHNVVAFHLGRRIYLRDTRRSLNYKVAKSEHSYLLYSLADGSYCYLKDYGSIVFINSTNVSIQKTIESILDTSINIENFPSEKYVLEECSSEEFHVEFDIIKIPELTLDIAHMIMLNLGQSVALDNYYNMSLSLLEKTRVHTSELEMKGFIKLSRKKLRQFIGKTMNLKNSIAENLFVFEVSDLAWTDKNLGKLDAKMRDELEIVTRHHGLQHNLDVISENLDFFKDILQHKHSSLLEWIIILLILFEILQVLFEKLF